MNTVETAVEVLKTKYKLPVTSVVQTMQNLGDNPVDWHKLIADTYGVKEVTPFQSADLAKCVARYLVQNVLKQHHLGEFAEFPRNLEELYLNSINQGTDYLKQHSWVFARPEAEEKLNADGTPASKKGDKKVMAKELYEANKGKGWTRKQWIELLIKEVGMTTGGASTYYANLKSGKY